MLKAVGCFFFVGDFAWIKLVRQSEITLCFPRKKCVIRSREVKGETFKRICLLVRLVTVTKVTQRIKNVNQASSPIMVSRSSLHNQTSIILDESNINC